MSSFLNKKNLTITFNDDFTKSLEKLGLEIFIKSGRELQENLRCPKDKEFERFFDFLNKEYTKEVMEMAYLKRKEDYLEIGFGSGTSMLMAAQSTQGKVYGYDLSPAMVDLLAEKFWETPFNKLTTSNLKFEHHDVESSQGIPQPDNSFDVVTHINVIYFWKDPIRVLREIYRVLKPGGRQVIGMAMKDVMEAVQTEADIFRTRFSKRDVIRVLKAIGFVDISILKSRFKKENRMIVIAWKK